MSRAQSVGPAASRKARASASMSPVIRTVITRGRPASARQGGLVAPGGDHLAGAHRDRDQDRGRAERAGSTVHHDELAARQAAAEEPAVGDDAGG